MVAADESTVIAKPLLDAIVMENSKGDRGLADSSSTNESDWNKVISEIGYLLDQLVASEEGPWGQRRGFPRYTRRICEALDPSVVGITDLARVYATVSDRPVVDKADVTYRCIFTITSFLTFHDGAVDVGYHCASVCNIAVNFGNGSIRASRQGRR